MWRVLQGATTLRVFRAMPGIDSDFFGKAAALGAWGPMIQHDAGRCPAHISVETRRACKELLMFVRGGQLCMRIRFSIVFKSGVLNHVKQ